MNRKPQSSVSLEKLKNMFPSNPGVHSKISMFAAGLRYTGQGDKARCEDCKVEISNGTKAMDPFNTHAAQSPNCPYVLQMRAPITSSAQCSSNTTSRMATSANEPENSWEGHNVESISNKLFEANLLQQVRRRTFSHWPHQTIPSAAKMIEAGFFNCNIGDRVICIYCNLICQKWTPDTNDPCEVHKTLSPKCIYVNARLTQPLTSSSIDFQPLNSHEIVDETPCHPDYADLEDREKSFPATWISDAVPSPKDLAEAGFFYTGNKNIVTCFHCNGSIDGLTAADSPMIEHARGFPRCPHAKQFCGENLHREIQNWRHSEESTTSNDTMQRREEIPNWNFNNQLVIQDDRISSELVAARLDLLMSKNVLSMNVRLAIVKRCWEDQLKLKNNDFATQADLWMACQILERQIVDKFEGKRRRVVDISLWTEQIRARQVSCLANTTTTNNDDKNSPSDGPISEWADDLVEKRIKEICSNCDVPSNILESCCRPQTKKDN